MSSTLTPEVLQRIKKAKEVLNRMKDIVPSDPKVADWLRNNEGPSDALFAIERLEQTRTTGDAELESLVNRLQGDLANTEANLRLERANLSTMRELAGVETNEELVKALRDLVAARDDQTSDNPEEETLNLTHESNDEVPFRTGPAVDSSAGDSVYDEDYDDDEDYEVEY